MGRNAGRCRISILALLICTVLLSATMASGIRTGVADGMGAPGPTAVVVQPATATAPPSELAPLDGTYKDSKRKVPNGPDPIHNRRARWGDAPARRV